MAFSRTLRALGLDRIQRSILLVGTAAGLLGAWFAWLLLSEVSVLAVSETARLESDQAVHPIQAPVSGKVVASALHPGRRVERGEVLVELDAERERLQLAEERASLQSLESQIASVDGESEATERTREEKSAAGRAALAEAGALWHEGDALAGFAEERHRRLRQLHASGLVAEVEMLDAAAEAERRRSVADALRLARQRVSSQQRGEDLGVQADLLALRRARALLEGQVATKTRALSRLEHEIERRRVRAPASGQIAESAELRVGSFVSEGARLGSVVTAGELKLVAHFRPSAALGRTRPGQAARLRLEGFTWLHYGAVGARVASVAAEPRDGSVRVELTIHPSPGSRIPLQHGLPGTVEVEVERVSPAALLLRAAGKL